MNHEASKCKDRDSYESVGMMAGREMPYQAHHEPVPPLEWMDRDKEAVSLSDLDGLRHGKPVQVMTIARHTEGIQHTAPESYKDATELELVRAVQEGNQEALLALVNRFGPLIKAYAKRLNTLAWGKEDVAQSLWVQFLQALQDYTVGSSVPLAGFLKQRIQYGHWNLFKKVRSVWSHEVLPSADEGDGRDLLGDSRQEPSVEAQVLEAWEHRRIRHRLRQALLTLDDKDRQLLYSLYLKGHTAASLAKTLGCSRQHVSQWHRRILKQLRRELEKDI